MNSVEYNNDSYAFYKLVTTVYEAQLSGNSYDEIAKLTDHSISDVRNIIQHVKLLDPSIDNQLLLHIATACQDMPSRYLTGIYLACKRNGINTSDDLKLMKVKEIRRLKGIGPNYRPVLLSLHRSLVYIE